MSALRMALIAVFVALVSACGGTAGTMESRAPSAADRDPDVEAILQAWRSGDFAAVFEAARRAAARENMEPRHRMTVAAVYGAALVRSGYDERGLRLLDSVVALSPRYAFAQTYRAEALFKLRRYSEAVAAASVAIEASPQSTRAYIVRAMANVVLRQNAAALADMNAAVSLAPQNGSYRRTRGFVHETMGRIDLAILDYRDALRLEPNDARARDYLTRALAASNRRGGPAPRQDIPLPQQRNDPPVIRL